jgi:saccharopine dehydrogenase-like NADP-dependent oxidoreductase
MHEVFLLGAGKIGQMIARFLVDAGDYHLRVGDVDPASLDRLREMLDVETLVLDVTNGPALLSALESCDSVISALCFSLNPAVAQAALEAGVSYFDLTEDIATARQVQQLAAGARPGQIFMPQCGLAPGLISTLGYYLARPFDGLDTLHLRVGALPLFPSNALNYNLTWSTDGLINEYCNPCQAIHEGRYLEVLPLEGLESFSLDGVRYEAFNTSGGLGTLCETLDGRVRELNYRTIRYVGHRDLMALLLNDLRLSQRRELLKDILEKAIPITYQDVVVIFCSVTGWQNGQFVQVSDARKIYNQTLNGRNWSAIQITTAAAVCAALDLHVAGKLPQTGLVKQEQIDFDDFIGNRFGRYYHSRTSTRFCRVGPDVPGPGEMLGDAHGQPPPSPPQSA